ncbi:hypothetical protein F5148DRAFT_932742 [Russula earlei]|uniref:Uncharacterized protein n=1 Tax=Russula earlei TaxID=71964 RepID=A0ACC0U9V5_9AGAM|nr:hypothetical protein F5148DRAFT_932742 [Russula earlei]
MTTTDHSISDRVTINTLPDDVLVEIFHFYVIHLRIGPNGWHTLVHVCQRWRHVVFASPRRLNLRLEYTGQRPMSEMLDVWPVLPVAIRHDSRSYELSNSYRDSWENVVGALESEPHRICAIGLPFFPTSRWERLAAAMQKPFPQLTFLLFWVEHNTVRYLPDSFLAGSAPLLRQLWLDNCQFPGIPKLLLSCSQLVVLSLFNIPDSGYISPQELGTSLSVTSRLETLCVQFQSPQYPASRPPLPLTRTVLPALTNLEFRGVHEYLEDLLAQIEAPLLSTLEITFFMDLEFVLPQLHRLISHAKSFKTCDRATVRTSARSIRFFIFRERPGISRALVGNHGAVSWMGSFHRLPRSLDSSFPPLSTLVQLDIVDDVSQPHWRDDTQWLELLHSFTAVKDLRLSHQVAPHVCPSAGRCRGRQSNRHLTRSTEHFLEGPRAIRICSEIY